MKSIYRFFPLLLPKKLLMWVTASALLITATSCYAQNKLSSREIADSFIKLHPDSIVYKSETKSRKWNYEQGVIMEAMFQMYNESGDWKYFDYIKKNLDYYINEDGTIKTYKLTEFNIDNITPGRAALRLYDITKLEKYLIAADTLRKQLDLHPRTSEGGFWHKKIYPHQIWLDGLYMAEPFNVIYSSLKKDTEGFDDIAKQFRLVEAHLKDPKTGLYFHGWDESKKEKWSNPQTGTSPNFWGRAIGWFLMSMVDVLDYMPQDHKERKEIIRRFTELSESLLKYRDEKTKLWYQIIDKGHLEGNYIEASASLMFIYSFAKGANKGYLDKKFFSIAEESFEGAVKNLITVKEDNLIYLNNVVSVGGLGNVPYRDGSFEYYISEPIRVNDFKGYGPLILSSIEIEKGKSEVKPVGEGKLVTLDYYFNNEWKNGKRYHYVWEDSAFSGYSDLGAIAVHYGANISSLETAPTLESLKKSNIYIIVDPDSTTETEKPNYISEQDITSISEWVNDGGVLVLLANDTRNCAFNNLNKLAENFGIHFNGDSKNRVTGSNYDEGKFDVFPNHPLFEGVKKLYLKEISTLKLNNPAKPVLSQNDEIIMASAEVGKGFVFAVGDPWLYNEYLDNRKIPESFENYKAARNLLKWLLQLAD